MSWKLEPGIASRYRIGVIGQRGDTTVGRAPATALIGSFFYLVPASLEVPLGRSCIHYSLA
jgi:hypothetical protein